MFAVATGGPVAVIAGPGAERLPATDASTSVAPAVVAPVAVAPVVPPVVPRVLPSGAPACGNVSWKTPIDPACQAAHEAAHAALSAVAAEAREIGQVLAVFDGFPDRPLTVAAASRPGS